jgi:hypothetical protein
MNIKFAHTNIISANWESLVQFYAKVFGCIPVPPQRNQSGLWLEKGTGVKNAQLKGMHLRLPGYGIPKLFLLRNLLQTNKVLVILLFR